MTCQKNLLVLFFCLFLVMIGFGITMHSNKRGCHVCSESDRIAELGLLFDRCSTGARPVRC
jgi:hypothetical protein